MRRIREAVLPLAGNNDDLPKTVREYRQKYKGVSANARRQQPNPASASHSASISSGRPITESQSPPQHRQKHPFRNRNQLRRDSPVTITIGR